MAVLAALVAAPAGVGLARPVPGASGRFQVVARAGVEAAGAQAGPSSDQTAAGSSAQPAAAVGNPRVVAKAAILADEATGQVLFERNAGAARAMASTTKVMTALLTLERLDERKVVTIGSGPPKVGEESLRLRRGERLTVRQLLLGLLVKSANDAGAALAEAVDGSEAAFVRRMNRKAAALRLTATHYLTPYGLDRPGHQTSARDLAHLWETAMRRADFRSLVATRAARIPGSPLSLRRFVTTNQLLGSYRWTVGGKTGFTNKAGRCLVASASRGGRRLVAVALGSPNAFTDVRALFEYGFSRFVRARLANRGQPVSQAPGRPPAYQAGADTDALVRLDQLGQVRLTLPAPANGSPGAGWFTVGGGRLVSLRLARLAGGGSVPGSSTTPTAPAGPGGGSAATATTVLTAPTTVAGAPTTAAGATLTPDTAVALRPVPPGAAAPVIDPFFRRAAA